MIRAYSASTQHQLDYLHKLRRVTPVIALDSRLDMCKTIQLLRYSTFGLQHVDIVNWIPYNENVILNFKPTPYNDYKIGSDSRYVI